MKKSNIRVFGEASIAHVENGNTSFRINMFFHIIIPPVNL